MATLKAPVAGVLPVLRTMGVVGSLGALPGYMLDYVLNTTGANSALNGFSFSSNFCAVTAGTLIGVFSETVNQAFSCIVSVDEYVDTALPAPE